MNVGDGRTLVDELAVWLTTPGHAPSRLLHQVGGLELVVQSVSVGSAAGCRQIVLRGRKRPFMSDPWGLRRSATATTRTSAVIAPKRDYPTTRAVASRPIRRGWAIR